MELLVEEPGQVNVKWAFWLLFKPFGLVGEMVFPRGGER